VPEEICHFAPNKARLGLLDLSYWKEIYHTADMVLAHVLVGLITLDA
jgi:hypothetical protein